MVNAVDVFYVIVILAAGYLCAKYIVDIFGEFFKKNRKSIVLKDISYSDATVDFVAFSIKYSIYLAVIILALAQLGFAEIVLQLLISGMIIVLLLIFLYSLRDFIPNAAAGLYLYKTQLVKVGDKVKISEFSGTVTKIDLLMTTLSEKEGKVIIIPNAIVTKREIIKW